MLAAVVALLALTASCTVADGVSPADPTAAPGGRGAADPTDPPPAVTQSPPPSDPSPSPTPTSAGSPTTVWLTADAVGELALGTEESLDDLLLLLGPPDSYDETLSGCGPGDIHTATWQDLEVFLLDGSELWGWAVGGTVLPDGVRPPHGLLPGDPMDAVQALPGAEVADDESEPAVMYGPMTYADGIVWHGPDESGDISFYGVRVPYCG